MPEFAIQPPDLLGALLGQAAPFDETTCSPRRNDAQQQAKGRKDPRQPPGKRPAKRASRSGFDGEVRVAERHAHLRTAPGDGKVAEVGGQQILRTFRSPEVDRVEEICEC